MVGNVNWTDDNHFTFKVMGARPNDPGPVVLQSVGIGE